MSRELRTTLMIIAVALIVASPLIFAEPGPATTSYLALVFHIVPTPTPTPIPTPVPPAIETLVIQLSEMKSGYVRDDWREITNADAAKTYANPKAAAAAFVTQGRETSWYTQYSSSDYAFSDAIGVANQLYRYLTPDGAAAGQAATIAESIHDHPDYRPFNISTPCCPTIGLRRTFSSGGYTIDQFLISVRIGRYVTEVQSIGVIGFFPVSRAIYYTQLAINHVYGVPQTMHADMLPAPASTPQPGTIDAALSPH
jgi:hypothetical protein